MEEKNLQQEVGLDSSGVSEKNGETMKEEVHAPAEDGKTITAEESSDVAASQTGVEPETVADDAAQVPAENPETEQTETPADNFKEKACEKLQGEKEKAKNKQFADPVIGYLLKRCEEDNGLAQDVMQEHKTWEKCFDYIYSQARKQAKGNTAAVRDDVVYEWAEDYYHKDDKAEEEKKAKEAAERKKKAKETVERKKKEAKQKKEAAGKKEKKPFVSQESGTYAKKEKEADKPAEAQKPKKNPKEMYGQMDLFSMMGM